jgi:thiamine-monophosphate kinase
MWLTDLKQALRFYVITDIDPAAALPPLQQVRLALSAGATIVQYRNKDFQAVHLGEARAIAELCRVNGVPFVVNDDLRLALALGADGLHLGQTDAPPALAREILGPGALIGISISDSRELARTDLAPCDYVGTGPIFATATKADAKPVRGLEGLREMAGRVNRPLVAIGGITPANAGACLAAGADGVAVISALSRAADPGAAARALAAACGCPPRGALAAAWGDEFGLIQRLTAPGADIYRGGALVVPPGDDAGLLAPLARPVVTTDTQREGVHFRRAWMTPEALGERAVEITFSDLAASYAAPVALFVNLGLPGAMSEATVERIYHGLHAALARHGASLGGGNLARSAALVLELFALGEGREGLFPRRGAARPGDGLYASGPLGLARAGRLALQHREPGYPELVRRFRAPRARFDAAAVLADLGVACAMDVSDGLAGDAGHIARASALTIELDVNAAPLHPELARWARAHGRDPRELMLAGGEDYELLFACPPERFAEVARHLPEVYPVGRCRPFAGRHLAGLPAGLASFQHGAADTGG